MCVSVFVCVERGREREREREMEVKRESLALTAWIDDDGDVYR